MVLYSLVVKGHDWDLEGCWFKPQCDHNKISAADGLEQGPSLSKGPEPCVAPGGIGPCSTVRGFGLKHHLNKSCNVFSIAVLVPNLAHFTTRTQGPQRTSTVRDSREIKTQGALSVR